jgi:hypothetical protein
MIMIASLIAIYVTSGPRVKARYKKGHIKQENIFWGVYFGGIFSLISSNILINIKNGF